jgi:two-component system response regulator (stage 0 sporulation protein F)
MKALKILVVDDEPGICELMADALSEQGHTVLCAENGVEAVARLAGEHVDIAFLDIRMPKGDGLTALREIRRLWPDLPVIMITGAGKRDEVEEGFRLGALSCLLKPFSLDDIAETINSFALGAREAA